MISQADMLFGQDVMDVAEYNRRYVLWLLFLLGRIEFLPVSGHDCVSAVLRVDDARLYLHYHDASVRSGEGRM